MESSSWLSTDSSTYSKSVEKSGSSRAVARTSRAFARSFVCFFLGAMEESDGRLTAVVHGVSRTLPNTLRKFGRLVPTLQGAQGSFAVWVGSPTEPAGTRNSVRR